MNLKSAPQEKLFIWNRSNVLQLRDTPHGLYPEARYHYRGRSPLAVLDYLSAHLQANDIIDHSITIHDFYSKEFPIRGVEMEANSDLYRSLLRKWDVEQLAVVDIDSTAQYCLQVYDFTLGLREMQLQEPDNNFFTHIASRLIAEIGLQKKFNQLQLSVDKKTAWLFTGELAFFMKSEVVKACTSLFNEMGASLPLLNYAYYDKYQLLNTAQETKISIEGYLTTTSVSALNTQLIADATGGVVLKSNGKLEAQLAIKTTRRPQLHIIDTQVKVMGLSGLQVDKGLLWVTGSKNESGKEKHGRLDIDSTRIETPEYIWHKDTRTASTTAKPISVKEIELNYNEPVVKPWNLPFSKTEEDRRILHKNFKRKVAIFLEQVKKENLSVIHGQKVLQGEPLNQKKAVSLLYETKSYLAPISGIIDLRDFDQGIIHIISDKQQLEDFGWAASVKRRSAGIYDINTISLPLAFTTGLSNWGRFILAQDIQEAISFAIKVTQSIIVCDFQLSAKQSDDLYQAGASVIICLQERVVMPRLENLSLSRGYGVFGGEDFSLPKKFNRFMKSAHASHAYFNSQSRELCLSKSSIAGSGKDKFAMKDKPSTTPVKNVISKGGYVLLITAYNPFQQAKVINIDEEEITVRLKSSGKLVTLGQEHLFLL